MVSVAKSDSATQMAHCDIQSDWDLDESRQGPVNFNAHFYLKSDCAWEVNVALEKEVSVWLQTFF